MSIVSSVVCFGVAAGFSLLLLVLPRLPALRAWAAAEWLNAVAITLTLFVDGTVLDAVFPVLALVAFAGCVLLLKGVALHVGRRLPIWQPLAVIAALMLLLLLDAGVLRTGYLGDMVMGLAVVVLNGWVVVILLRNTPAELRLSYRLAAAVFLLNALLGVLSLIPSQPAGPEVAALQGGMVQLAEVCVGIVLALAQCFALMLLIVEQMLAELHHRATRDGLTGLLNRASLVTSGLREVGNSAAKGEAFAVLIIDLDHFKRVNDTWGHLSGDEVLRHFAASARSIASGHRHLLGRYGGEEFVLLLPGATAADAMAVATELVQASRAAQVPVASGQLGYTVSIGVASTTAGAGLEALLSHADMALYRAKAEGRDRACLADGPPLAGRARDAGGAACVATASTPR